MNIPDIFPFTQRNIHTYAWFDLWFQENRKFIDNYGNYYRTHSKSVRKFNYYEADAFFRSEIHLTIEFYDADFGQRGDLICTVDTTVPLCKGTSSILEKRVDSLVACELQRIEQEAEKERLRQAHLKLRSEMYPHIDFKIKEA